MYTLNMKNIERLLTKKCLDCPTMVQDHNERCRPCFLRLPGKPLEESFIKFVYKTETCWLWTGAKARGDYGSFHLPKTRVMVPAHRQAWILYKGEIPIGLRVLHKCDRPNCVNPDHLFLGTTRDNSNDMLEKRRGKVWGHPQKLTPNDVIKIRELYATDKYTLKELGKMYNCHFGTIFDALHRR